MPVLELFCTALICGLCPLHPSVPPSSNENEEYVPPMPGVGVPPPWGCPGGVGTGVGERPLTIIVCYWFCNAAAWLVMTLPEVMSGIAVLVTEYCIEAKMPLAASVCRASVVQAAINEGLLFFPSFGTALGA